MTRDALEVLRHGDTSVEGRLIQASNATFFAVTTLDGVDVECVYKPVRGERPLWDFPDGTLADREVATYLLSELTGWGIVPPTVIGGGPFGPGMLQEWVHIDDTRELVDLVEQDAVPDGWRHVLDAYDQHDRPVALVHADDPGLRRMALLDAVTNNTDRKAGHVLPLPDGSLRGCDHGVTFHVEDKLRTILWGWVGEAIDGADLAVLEEVHCVLQTDAAAGLAEHLTQRELSATRGRLDRLLRERTYPLPAPGWHAIPWPAW